MRTPPWFIFAFESELTLPTVRDRLIAASAEPTEVNKRVDAVFVQDRGWIINFGTGNGMYQFRRPTGEKVQGWAMVESNHVVFDFLSWLSAVMTRELRLLPILPLYLIDNPYVNPDDLKFTPPPS